MTAIASYRSRARNVALALGGAAVADATVHAITSHGLPDRLALLLAGAAPAACLAWLITAIAGHLDQRNTDALDRTAGLGLERGLQYGLDLAGGRAGSPADIPQQRKRGETVTRLRDSS